AGRSIRFPSNFLELSRLLSTTFAVVFEFEAHSIALIQHANAGGFDRGSVNENVFAASVDLDKTEPLSCVEELYGPINSHDFAPSQVRCAAHLTRPSSRSSSTAFKEMWAKVVALVQSDEEQNARIQQLEEEVEELKST